jgi:hypothetical protein
MSNKAMISRELNPISAPIPEETSVYKNIQTVNQRSQKMTAVNDFHGHEIRMTGLAGIRF